MHMLNFLWFSLFCQLNKDQPLPKFGEWDVNNPASASEFTVIFDKVRGERKSGGGGTSSSVSPSPKYTASEKYSHSSKSNNKVSIHFISLPIVFGPWFYNSFDIELVIYMLNAEKVVLPLLSCSFGLSLPLKISERQETLAGYGGWVLVLEKRVVTLWLLTLLLVSFFLFWLRLLGTCILCIIACTPGVYCICIYMSFLSSLSAKNTSTCFTFTSHVLNMNRTLSFI